MLPKKNPIAVSVSMEAGFFTNLFERLLKKEPKKVKFEVDPKLQFVYHDEFLKACEQTLLVPKWVEENVIERAEFKVSGKDNVILGLAGKEGEITAQDIISNLDKYYKWQEKILQPEKEKVENGRKIFDDLNKQVSFLKDYEYSEDVPDDLMDKAEDLVDAGDKKYRKQAEALHQKVIKMATSNKENFNAIIGMRDNRLVAIKDVTVSITSAEWIKVIQHLKQHGVHDFYEIARGFNQAPYFDSGEPLYLIEMALMEMDDIIEFSYYEQNGPYAINHDYVYDGKKLFELTKKFIKTE